MTGINSEMNTNGAINAAWGLEEVLQFATFRLNAEIFGINILQVQEIQLPQEITVVPRAQPHVMGLISLRGQIVTLIDLRQRLRMDTSQPIDHPYHIVVKTPQTIACFEVAEIGDVINVPIGDYRPPPDSVHAVDRMFLDGVYSMPDGILSVLNVDAVLETV